MSIKLPVTVKRFHLLLFGGVFSAIATIMAMRMTPQTYADESEPHPISDSHFVTIHDQGEKLTVKTDASTVEEALERAGYSVQDTDRVEPALNDGINSDNFHINIYRSRPVLVADGGVRKYIMTASYDPRGIAEEAGFTVYDGDEIDLQEDNNQFLEAGNASSYELTRNGGRTVTVETTIPYAEETQDDDTLEEGQTKLVEAGEEGRMVSQYKVEFVDGEEVSRELISEEVTAEPTPRVTANGTKKKATEKDAASSSKTSTTVAVQGDCADWVRQAGVAEEDVQAALTIIYRESGCRYNATNSSSGAYGIPQALPGSKMASAGADWETNPVTQIKWMAGYVKRYGGWQGAVEFWNSHHWY